MRIRGGGNDDASSHKYLARYQPRPAMASMESHAMDHGGADLNLLCGEGFSFGVDGFFWVVVQDVVEDRTEGVFSPERCTTLEGCGEFFICEDIVVELDDRREMVFPEMRC